MARLSATRGVVVAGVALVALSALADARGPNRERGNLTVSATIVGECAVDLSGQALPRLAQLLDGLDLAVAKSIEHRWS